MKTNIQDVVAEFDKKYVTHCSDGEILDGMVDAKKVKNWLTTTLTQLVKEVETGERERIKQEYGCMNNGCGCCMDETLEQALTPSTSDVIEK